MKVPHKYGRILILMCITFYGISTFLYADEPIVYTRELDDFDTIQRQWQVSRDGSYRYNIVTEQAHSGAQSMKVEYRNNPSVRWPFFAVPFNKDGKDNNLFNYNKLSFWVFTETSPLTIKIKFEDYSYNAWETDIKTHRTNQWVKLNRDISQAGNKVKMNNLKWIIFFADPYKKVSSATFYIDDLTVSATESFYASSKIISEATEGIDSISTYNYANKTLKYYYFIPSAVVKSKEESYPLLVMIPGLSGRGEDFVTKEFKQFASEEKFIIVSPTFAWDEKNFKSKRSYQYPTAWSGKALLKIIDKLKEDNGVDISEFYLFGHSAGAQFVLRFCFWRSKLCTACAAHGCGGSVIPNKKVKTKFFVTVGRRDDTSRIYVADQFYDLAKKKRIDVELKKYSTDHTLIPAQIKDSIKFFRSVR